MISDLSPALLSWPYSDANRSSSIQWDGEGEAQARFKGCIGTNTKVEAGICQEEPGRPLHRLLRLLNGALLVSQGPGDNAGTLWGRILHLLNTKLHFVLWTDKSFVSLSVKL